MYNSGSTVSVDQWISKSQYITRPGANSGWDDAVAASATTSTGHTHTASGAGSDGIGSVLTGDGTQTYFQLENVFKMLEILQVPVPGTRLKRLPKIGQKALARAVVRARVEQHRPSPKSL